MTKYYHDYFWKEGIPYGIEPLQDWQTSALSYKIVMDPYRKRISIEKYVYGRFITTIYDSNFLNFRHLNQIDQPSWQKITVHETPESSHCLIRDQDDRIVFIETYFFQKNYCTKCIAKSPQGLLLSTQWIHYKILGEAENKVTLFDANHHPVLQKYYEADPITGEFTHLIQELKDMQGVPLGQN